MLTPLRIVGKSFACGVLVVAFSTSSSAYADREKHIRLYAQEFSDARQIFWDCMQDVNSKQEYESLLSKTFRVDQSTQMEREAAGEAKFRDHRYFSEQEISEILDYDKEFQLCTKHFGLSQPDKYASRNGLNWQTRVHFNGLARSTEQLVQQANVITIGEYNRYRHYHYSAWQSRIARVFRTLNETRDIRVDALTYGPWIDSVLASGSISYANSSGTRYLKVEAELAPTAAGALGVKNAPKGVKMRMRQSNPVVAEEVEHDIWLAPGYSSGSVTSVRRREREDITNGWVYVHEGNEIVLGTNRGSRPFDLDTRERLIVTEEKIELFREVFLQGEWTAVRQDAYWILTDEEIKRLGARYPFEPARQ